MLLLDITVVNVALPDIQTELHTSFTDLQWVVDAYALTLATSMLNAGTLGDLLGRKRVFTAGVALFTLASALCGAASSPLFLILARGGHALEFALFVVGLHFGVGVLDAGRRDWLRDLCAREGAGYVPRADNRHAKAGNINNGLAHLAAAGVGTPVKCLLASCWSSASTVSMLKRARRMAQQAQ